MVCRGDLTFSCSSKVNNLFVVSIGVYKVFMTTKRIRNSLAVILQFS